MLEILQTIAKGAGWVFAIASIVIFAVGAIAPALLQIGEEEDHAE